ncbi:outer membrane beta-barrel family protein [Chryseobacterium sp. B21-037]|uniref:outer membrane beta-barrel protein n=1 Tax=unclassified Chryseobacterium TaxID=2593645 RepID=UPI002359EAD3|nr:MULTISPECIES: outer membrane beta-barrel protein [unclassified Chryseobacterium]MDC8105055.1 outer membrane beta-barrel family protein [Chryseobacterium sp. B21-037]MDQ1805313.1 outer membrane beta-barrel protein [Chryseobacterium sp. CKR4-1]
MKKILLVLIILINTAILNGQKLAIDGKVMDFEKKPVENATVYLLKQKDSSIINYTPTNKEGKFSLKTDPSNEPTVLKIDAEKLVSYSKNIEKINQSLSLGSIELEKNSVFNIEEVKLTVSPVKIKKDTIEFNASSIKVRPDSKIEELLKQIPGVEISNEGKITVNGKDVDQIMINGKPFFDKDGKIALQNLPADIIKNIQFTTTKTKEEELNGKTAKSNNTTINFNIDEKKNKGLISRLTLGYGSDKRYEGSGLISYFKKDTKISLLASSNNINSQGFSNDEVFDSMGRGRNSWMMQGGSVMTVGGNTYYYQGGGNTKGIQRSTTIGFNYSDKLGKDADLETMSFMHSNNNLKTRSKVSRTTLLPDYTLKTNSESSGENENRQYNFDTAARIKLDSLTSIYISPSFSRSEGSNFNNSTSSTFRDNTLLNESNAYTSTDSESNSFNPNIYFSRKFRKKGRVVYANINSNISESKSNNLNQSRTVFYQNNGTNDDRNQLAKNKTQNSNYRFSTGYTEPLSDSATVSLNLNYEAKISGAERNVNDFDANTGQYSKYNSVLSNSMDQKINQLSPELSFELNKNKINIWSSVNLQISDMKVNSVFNDQQYDLQKSFVLPSYNLNLQYQFSQNKRLSLYNYADFNIPSAEQLTPYEDLSNPLITYKGNPDLKNTWTNRTYLYFSNYNMVKDINYYVNIGFTYGNNDVTNYSYYDNSGKQFVTYANISGNKNINLGGGFSKSFKWKENKLVINPRINTSYGYNRGFINSQQFSSGTYSINPGLNLTYEVKDKFTIKPSYSIGYNFSNYTNYSIEKVQTTNQILKLQLTNYLFKSNLVFGNDFEYNTNSNIAPGFKRDFYFWNTSLGYSFFKKQLTAKIKVYDVLNQNQSVRRTITNSYFEDRDDLILKRYVMFSLSMKLNKFAGKKMRNQ